MADWRAKKEFKDFEVLLTIDDEGKGDRLWMKVEYKKGNYESESWFVHAPNFIERWRGITWQDKIANMEKRLFLKLLKKIEKHENIELKGEILKWVKGAENVQ